MACRQVGRLACMSARKEAPAGSWCVQARNMLVCKNAECNGSLLMQSGEPGADVHVFGHDGWLPSGRVDGW